MNDPLAFLLTFRTYGTWLHGDERGSVDREHNAPGAPFLPPNEARRQIATAAMRHDPLLLTESMREVVDAAIVDECSFRKWELTQRAVRTNHVHIVVGFAGVKPELMIQKLKARATRWLRENNMVGLTRPVWSDRAGSRRYLWTAVHVTAACAYVLDGQDTPR